jgi:ribonuclease HI
LISADEMEGSAQLNNYDKGYAEVFCDGACSGNPGRAGIGVVIVIPDADRTYYRISEHIGITTNNVAEYTALIRGLEKAGSLGINKVKVFLDSELVVKQINGLYKVKNRNLIQLWNRAKDILSGFDEYLIAHVSRDMNKEADMLAKKAAKQKN